MKPSRERELHLEWIGYVQPDGLVVSAVVLDEAAVYTEQPLAVQQTLRGLCSEDELPDVSAAMRVLTDVLGWPSELVVVDVDGLAPWGVDLVEERETLRPAAVLRDPAHEGAALVLVHAVFDDETEGVPSRRLARHLVELQGRDPAATPIGLLCEPDALTLVYAPRGGEPGFARFGMESLTRATGRLVLDALVMLLGRARLLTAPPEKRLRALLEASRQRQAEVTAQLASQVEEALVALLAGFERADGRARGQVYAALDPNASEDHLLQGITTVLLRLVFVLYAEDQGLLPVDHPIYARNYSARGLADALRADRDRYGSSMTLRHGAWPRLLALFRLIFAGAEHRGAGETMPLRLPPRQGNLFDPADFPFLEGRGRGSREWRTDSATAPLVDDDAIETVLHKLIVLEGQRLSYKNLDVEQIGSVYEALMRFKIRRVGSTALVLRSGVIVEVDELLAASDIVALVATASGLKRPEVERRAPALLTLPKAQDVGHEPAEAAILAALQPLSNGAPPTPPGGHVLDAGSARRHSGSHYTPRSLSEPIVERTLSPLLERLGTPTAEQILALRVCDPAMGSGAFLVQACRFLSERLVETWIRTGTGPRSEHDGLGVDPRVLAARREVAERCLYGVDKNPFAVQLARLSLWLFTLSRDLPFTFLDHALREGDSLIGVDVAAMASFSLDGKGAARPVSIGIRKSLQSAVRARGLIHAPEFKGYDQRRRLVREADHDVFFARVLGDLLIACHARGGSAKELRLALELTGDAARWWAQESADLGDLPEKLAEERAGLTMRPFHWALEFPEIFTRDNPGFDAVIGNPPFGGKNLILASNGEHAIELLKALWPHSHGNADYVAYFVLRTVAILRENGTFGLIATNTVHQGDTRDTGLRHVMKGGVTLFNATVDLPWPVPGAAVVVDVLCGVRGPWNGARVRNGTEVLTLNSDLAGENEAPPPTVLSANDGKCFEGVKPRGRGFFFTPAEADEFRLADGTLPPVIRPFLGGEELNRNHPPYFERFIADFGEGTLGEALKHEAILRRVESAVRDSRKDLADGLSEQWWVFERTRPKMRAAIAGLTRCLVKTIVSKHHLVAFVPAHICFGNTLNVYAFDDYANFAVIQSRVHELWARNAGLGSTFKTDNRNTPSRSFATFPFPVEAAETLRMHGCRLEGARLAAMEHFRDGMNEVWDRLVRDDRSASIQTLREARDEMDRAVLAAYGWSGLAPTDTQEIVARLRRLNAERAEEEAGRKPGGA